MLSVPSSLDAKYEFNRSEKFLQSKSQSALRRLSMTGAVDVSVSFSPMGRTGRYSAAFLHPPSSLQDLAVEQWRGQWKRFGLIL